MASTTLQKRLESNHGPHLSTGPIIGIVLGVLVIVALSIFCCCPCWKKGGARPKALRSDSGGEDVGNEIGGTEELDGDGTTSNGIHEVHAEEIPPPEYEKFSGVEMPAKPENVVINGGVKE